MKQLHHQSAIGLEVGTGKIHRQLHQMRNARRVCRLDAGQIGSHVRHHHIHHAPSQRLLQPFQDFGLTKIAVQERDTFNGLHGQDVQRNDAPIELPRRRT